MFVLLFRIIAFSHTGHNMDKKITLGRYATVLCLSESSTVALGLLHLGQTTLGGFLLRNAFSEWIDGGWS
jgi:hypothetical protein